MHLPLKVVQEVLLLEACAVCGKSNLADSVHVLRTHVFTKESSSSTDPLCTTCMAAQEGGVERTLELEEPEVQGPNRGKALRAQKRRSQRQERDLAEELGARVQKASGALSGSKGDLRKKGLLRIEAKYTEAGSYSLKLDDLLKILSECEGTEKPVLVVEYVDKGTKKMKERFAVIHFEDLKEILHAAGYNR